MHREKIIQVVLAYVFLMMNAKSDIFDVLDIESLDILIKNNAFIQYSILLAIGYSFAQDLVVAVISLVLLDFSIKIQTKKNDSKSRDKDPVRFSRQFRVNQNERKYRRRTGQSSPIPPRNQVKSI